jgi:3-hydroxymyristoyl/3-hydroxydecanoyl-(acyl carrier protein) dehydratase
MSPDPDHFAAYSFVDRIDEFVPGRHARGRFAIPPGLASFSSCFVAEAVGQLAAWVAMDKIDFRGRPVAALATDTVFHSDAKPGEILDLEVDILECDDEAVAYNGRAGVAGRRIVELIDCLGPMLPVADFDSPEALRERLALLRGAGAPPGRFHGVERFPVSITHRVPGTELRATLSVPRAAPFFGDHFPRRPVFPATLLLDAQLALALDLARFAPALHGAIPRPQRVTHVKMRSFIEPEQSLEIGVELVPLADGQVKAMLSARTDGRLVASARLEIAGTPGGLRVAETALQQGLHGSAG